MLVPHRSRGYSWEFLVGVCHLLPKILTLFQTKKCYFPTRFQTWSLGKLFVVITYIRPQTKNSSNAIRSRIFLFRSYSFGIETINTLILSLVPLKTIPDFRPKWTKCIPVFGPKRPKNPTRWGSSYVPIWLI